VLALQSALPELPTLKAVADAVILAAQRILAKLVITRTISVLHLLPNVANIPARYSKTYIHANIYAPAHISFAHT
jgi:hypothetical protein